MVNFAYVAVVELLHQTFIDLKIWILGYDAKKVVQSNDVTKMLLYRRMLRVVSSMVVSKNLYRVG